MARRGPEHAEVGMTRLISTHWGRQRRPHCPPHGVPIRRRMIYKLHPRFAAWGGGSGPSREKQQKCSRRQESRELKSRTMDMGTNVSPFSCTQLRGLLALEHSRIHWCASSPDLCCPLLLQRLPRGPHGGAEGAPDGVGASRPPAPQYFFATRPFPRCAVAPLPLCSLARGLVGAWTLS